MLTHTIQADFISGMEFKTNVNDHTLTLDLSSEDGGANHGPRPKLLMLSALAGCTGLDVVSLLNKMKAPFKNFSIQVSAMLTDEHPKIYKDVHIVYYIHVSKEDQSKVEKAVNLSQEKYCGVSAMFKAFATLSYKIEFR